MHASLKSGIVFMIVFTFYIEVIGQCGNCPPNDSYVSETLVKRYSNHYTTFFHTNDQKKLSHSLSVDFSKEAIISFYENNFGTGSNNGFNVHFVAYNTDVMPNQKAADQIGLLLAPTRRNCSTDSAAFKIFNNSFNQSDTNYTPTTQINTASRNQLFKYGTFYNDFHRKNDKKKYTNFIHFNRVFIQMIYDNLTASTAYSGVRFEIGVYNQLGEACGQADAKQLTVFIVPVRRDGSADYDLLFNYINSPKIAAEKNVLLPALNHGELCPNNCN